MKYCNLNSKNSFGEKTQENKLNLCTRKSFNQLKINLTKTL